MSMYIMFIRCHRPYRTIPSGPLAHGRGPSPILSVRNGNLGTVSGRTGIWTKSHHHSLTVSVAPLTQLAMAPLSTWGRAESGPTPNTPRRGVTVWSGCPAHPWWRLLRVQ